MPSKTIHDIATSSSFSSLDGTEEVILWKDSTTKGGLISILRDWILAAIPAASGSIAGLMSSANYTKLNTLATVSTTGAYTDLTGRPVLEDVATSGDYADLTGTPVEATTSVAGLLSAADKTKLDGVATGANNYTLPAASASLGGVLQGTAVANSVDTTDVVAQLNSLLSSLRTAGVIAA